MGFSLKNMFEDAWADINPFDNGQTGATLRAARQKAAPVVTPPAGTRSLTVRSAAPSPANLTVADAPQSRVHPIDMSSLQMPKTQPLTVAPAQPAQLTAPKPAAISRPIANPTTEQSSLLSQLESRDKLDSNGRVQLYGKAMRAGVIDHSAAMDAINHEVSTQQRPKVDTSLFGQVKGIAHDELQLGKDTVNGIKDGVGNTVNLAGDAILKPAISTFGNDQQKRALNEKMGQDFQGSIPGAIYRPLDLIGNTLGSSLAANKLHNEGVDDNIITRAVNDQTARNGINTNNSMFENDRKIAGAGAETALNLATVGAPLTGELKDQVAAQTFRQLDSKAVSQALAERAATNGTSKLVEAAKSGVVNSAYGAGSGVAATLQEDQIHPEDFVKNAATGAISGAAMGTAMPYIHAGLATGAERAATAIDNAAARREAQHYQFAAADSPTYHVRPDLINPIDLSGVDPAAVKAAEKEALNGRLTPVTVAIDENGMANVVEGYDRLAALTNLGADQIPTKAVSPSALRAIKQGGYIGGSKAAGFGDAQVNGRVFDGVDGKPRFEATDREARLVSIGDAKDKLGNLLDHPTLYQNYPELRDLPVDIKIDKNYKGAEGGQFNPDGTIEIYARNHAEAKKVLLHEVQHAIQKAEEFATGSNPDEIGQAAYHKSAGEAEARAVADRRNMTDDERYAAPKDAADYGIAHRPNEDGGFGHDITKSADGEDFVPKDVYDHPEWYFQMSGDYGAASKESMDVVKAIRNKPDADVTVYRSGTKNELNKGDWITLSKKYADMHQTSNGERGDAVHSFKVKAKDLRWPGDDINEFGYYPEKQPLRSTFYDSLDVPKDQLTVRNDGSSPAMSISQNKGSQEFAQNRLTKGAKDHRQNLSEETIKQVEGEHAVRNTQQLADNAQAQAVDAPLQDLIDQVHERMAVSPGKISDEDVALAQQAIERADAEGRPNDASAIHDALSEHLVASGQTVQAASLLYQRSPQGILYKALRDIKKAGVEETPEMKRRLQSLTDNIKKAPDENAKMRAIAKLHKEVAKIIPQSKINGALSVWKAGLLSGVKTQGGNFISNGTFSALKTSSDPVAAAFDRAFSAFTKERTKTATQRGTFSGAKEGTGKAVDTMRTGFDERNINGGKYEEHGEIHFKNKVVQAIVGTPANLVFRGMNAADQPFYYSALRKNLNDLAKADGMTKGLRGKALKDHMQATVADPPVAMAQKATDAAWKSVLGYDTLASKAISAVHRGIDNLPMPKGREKSTQIAKNAMHAGVNVLAPFTRVPTAFLARTLDYTPIGAIKEVAAQVANGHFDQRAMSEALGEATTGTSVIFLGASLASSGLLSGQYPSDPKEQQRWKAEGRTANSVKIGNKWVSLNYLGPVGMLFGAGKDYHDAAARGDSATMAAIAGSAKNLSQQSFLTGFSGFSNAINDPQRSAKSFVNSQTGSVVPAWMNDMANLGDDNQRETHGVTDSIKSRVPGARNTLPVKEDVYGNELKQRSNRADVWLDPLRPSNQQHSPTLDEVSRLHDVDPNNKNLEVTPTPLQKKLSFGGTDANGQGVQTQLSDSQLHDLQHQVGQATQDGWSKLIKTSEYKALSDEDKAKALNNMAGDIASAEKTRYAQANSLGQYAPDFNGKNKKVSKAAQVFLTGQPDATKYAKNVNAVSGNTTPISSELGKSDADILNKYDAMTTEDRSKWFSGNNDAEYRYNQAKYNNDKANGTLTRAEDARASAGLAKDKIGSTFSKETRDLYGLSKEELWGIVSTDPNGKKMAEDVLAFGDALANAGVGDNKFRTSKGAVAIQPKPKGGSRSSKGKSSHGISYKMTGYLDTSTTGKSLRQILAEAKVTGKSKRPK